MTKLPTPSYSPEGTLFLDAILEICRLNGRLLAEEESLLQAFGLTSARWKVLGVLSRFAQSLTVPQISRRIGLSRQNIQRLVDVLEVDGLLDYQIIPDHKRAKLVSVTPKGQQRYAAVRQVHIPWVNHCAEGFNAADLEKTLKIIRTLIGQLGQK